MAAPSLGKHRPLSFAFMKAHNNPKQLRIVVPSSVSFPVLDSGTPLIANQRPPHLPFRRISLPSAPSPMMHRQSVVSMESFESLPEEGAGTSQIITISSKPPFRRSPPSAFDSPTRSRPRRRPYNDRNDDKRRRIINEFYETERSYFGGLELIYSVSCTLLVSSALN
jgi:FYVE, RhoGEF and PH domain containing 5/6